MLSFCAVPDSLKLKIKESFPEATFFIPEEPKTPRKREKKPKKVKDLPKLESETSDSSV
jgi:hypothetical protein